MPTLFRILLIDNDTLLKGILEKASKESFPEATYTSVGNVNEAKQYINSIDGYGPKLIFLDLELKDTTSGLDFLAFLRDHSQARLLPVIILSVQELPTRVKEAYDLGANSFMVKPSSFGGWQTYLGAIRNYWLNTATLPQVRFGKST